MGKHCTEYAAHPEIDSIASLIKADKDLRLMLVGHADRSGSAALNPLTCPSAGTGSEKVLIRHYEIEEQGIVTKSRGYDEHIKEITDPYLSHLDRRVDIFLVRP